MLSRVKFLPTSLQKTTISVGNIFKKTLEASENRDYSVPRAYQLKTPSAKQYATDGKGVHTAQTQAICDKKNCEIKTCPIPCSKVTKIVNRGHYTHKPSPNSQNEFLSSVDFNGNQKDQYFVKSPNPPEISENDFKPNTDADTFALVTIIAQKVK